MSSPRPKAETGPRPDRLAVGEMALKSCPAPGCPELVEHGYCSEHQGFGYQRGPDAADRQAIYNSRRWKALRRQVQKSDPWCAVIGCQNLATQLDHIVPLRTVLANGLDPYDRANVQPLCAKHPGEKTRTEQYGFKA